MCLCLADAAGLYGNAGWAGKADEADEAAVEVSGEAADEVSSEASAQGGWSFFTTVVLVGVLLAVVAFCIRLAKKDTKDTIAYEKIAA